MKQEVEIEIKSLINENTFIKLLDYFNLNTETPILQINHYFDTFNFDLNKNESALRIREKNETFELTLKEKHNDHILENNLLITKEQFLKYKNNEITFDIFKNKINLNTINNIKYILSLTTKRYKIKFSDFYLFIDKNYYLNNIDYEVEIESTSYDLAHSSLKDIFNKIKEEYTINETTKSSRAFNAYNNK